jgi:hypothetical protein
MRYDTDTSKIIRLGVVMGLLLLGLLLAVIASWLSMISLDALRILLVAMVLTFPLIISALMQSMSSDN